MDQMFPEIISHILSFLSLSDRKEAALVCKRWYNASLHPCLQKNVIMKCRPPHGGKSLMPSQIFRRKITHLVVGDTMSSKVNDDNLITLLCQCPNLTSLDLSGCNSIFLSGRLLSEEKDQLNLRNTLQNVKELKLARLRHMTDVTFARLVSVLDNLMSISLASTNMIFGTSPSTMSPAVFHFANLVNFISSRASQIKTIDLSHTTVNDQSLDTLCKVPGLFLDEMILCGCMELSDKGIKSLAMAQSCLKKLNLSGCKELGNSKIFFSNMVQNMHHLHTLRLRKCPKIGQCDIASLNSLSTLRVLDLGEALNLYERDLVKGLCSPHVMLSSLHLAYCPDICDAFVITLCQTNPSLQDLDLTSCNRITDASVHAISQNLLSLRSLHLAYCHQLTDLGILGCMPENGASYHHSFEFDQDSCCCMRDKESRIFRKPTGMLKNHQNSICKAQTQLESGEVLFKLSNLTYLETLDLSSCSRITDLGIAEAIQFNNLRRLSLNSLPRLTDKGVQHLVRSNPSLEDVAVRACAEITDEGLCSLATHTKCLSSLDISQNDKLTDESVFMVMAKCRRLRHLDVSFCGRVSIDNIIHLQSQYDRVKFHFRPHIYV